MRPTKEELENLFWRSVWTFVATFTGALGAAGLGWVEASGRESALIAAVGSVITVLSVFARTRLGTMPVDGGGS